MNKISDHLTDAEKALEKIQNSFMIKIPNRVDIQGTYINIIKAIYNKPTANIIPIPEKLKVCPPRSETGQGCSFSPPQQKTRKRNKRHSNQKKQSKTVTICR